MTSSSFSSSSSVVCLGIHIVDILGRPVTSIPPGQNVSLLEEIRITVAGTAAGCAIDIAKLTSKNDNINVVTMGAIGTDELGNFVINTMTQHGIDTSSLVRKSDVQTSATMLPIRPNGERPALHVPGANHQLTYADLDLEVLRNARVLHFGGTGLMSSLDGADSVRTLRYAKEHGVITTFDLVAIPRPDMLDLIEPLLPYIDYFMPGLEEARMICGMQGEEYSRTDVIQFFLRRGVKTVVFKMGERGSVVANNEIGEIDVPAFQAEKVVDTTGCGDSYCAGFIVGILKGWDLEEAARLGSACGALVVTGLGSDAGIVDYEETVNFMEIADIIDFNWA